MKTYLQDRLFQMALILICVLAIVFRLDIENNSMNSQEVKRLKNSQETYSTKLKVNNDPEFSNFTVKISATDLRLNRRVIAMGSSQVTNLISGAITGDEIIAVGYLSGLADFQRYRKYEHIVGVFNIESVLGIKHSSSLINESTQQLRDTVMKGCSRLEVDERGVCEGLLIGKRTNISHEVYKTYRDAQLTHLLVASGANIVFLMSFLGPVLNRLSRNLKTVSIVMVAIYYCAVTHFEPSILRACAMVAIPAVLSMRGFVLSKSQIFMWTILLCTLIDPFLIYRVGYWLSLCATAGLYFISPKMKLHIKSELVRNTLSATLCVQPVLWFEFGFQIPVKWWVSVFAIAIAEPLSTVGMVLIFIVSFLNPESFVSNLFEIPVQWGCLSLNYLAKIGSTSIGYWAGWFCSVSGLIAYTYRGRSQMREARKSERSHVRKVSVLHYR